MAGLYCHLWLDLELDNAGTRALFNSSFFVKPNWSVCIVSRIHYIL